VNWWCNGEDPGIGFIRGSCAISGGADIGSYYHAGNSWHDSRSSNSEPQEKEEQDQVSVAVEDGARSEENE
jgi:hypothetical protein